jgi:hypothetical protein
MKTDLLHKIHDLFDYRGFPILFKNATSEQILKDGLYQKLIQLQADIYHLDSYLENNWDVNDMGLEVYWSEIFNSLSSIGVTSEKHHDYVKQILKYQKHEIELRSYKLPTRMSMEYFYFYKSCDVKLIRRLIAEFLPGLQEPILASEWRYFDLITEINDDVTDIEEDISTINGNRVLISLNTLGSKQTLKDFSAYMTEVVKKSKEKYASGSTKEKNIHERTVEQATITKQLLDQKMKLYTNGLPCTLFSHLNHNTTT